MDFTASGVQSLSSWIPHALMAFPRDDPLRYAEKYAADQNAFFEDYKATTRFLRR